MLYCECSTHLMTSQLPYLATGSIRLQWQVPTERGIIQYVFYIVLCAMAYIIVISLICGFDSDRS